MTRVTRGRGWLWSAVVAVVAALVLACLVIGGAFGGAATPVARGSDLTIESTAFTPGQIAIRVTNPQSAVETVAIATIDDAIVPFETTGSKTLMPHASTTIDVPFDWVATDPYKVCVTSSHGIPTEAVVTAPAVS